MFYMCAFYGVLPGLIADGALVLNIFFTMGILASYQAVLTLPGIAGMVLTLGMAVDANVLIYERTKEELRAGKSLFKPIVDMEIAPKTIINCLKVSSHCFRKERLWLSSRISISRAHRR